MPGPLPTGSPVCTWDGTRPARVRRSDGVAGLARLGRAQDVVRVDDPVGVALLGEEPLPVGGEVGVDGVAGDDGVEVRGAPVTLGSQHPAEALGLLLT